MPICYSCNKEKLIGEFEKLKKAETGYRNICKSCRSSRKKELYNYFPNINIKYSKYKSSAKTRGISFDLTKEQFSIFWQANCHYCGDQIATIGIDRVDSNLGYNIKNCVPCCTFCNKIKLNYDIEILNTHLIKMLKYQGLI